MLHIVSSLYLCTYTRTNCVWLYAIVKSGPRGGGAWLRLYKPRSIIMFGSQTKRIYATRKVNVFMRIVYIWHIAGGMHVDWPGTALDNECTSTPWLIKNSAFDVV